MDTASLRQRAYLSWLFMGVLVLLVCALAALQYKWIGEVSRAEQKTFRENLATSIANLGREFDTDLNAACRELVPNDTEIGQLGITKAYERRYANWKASNRPELFLHVALIQIEEKEIAISLMKPGTASFQPASWPNGWERVKHWTESRINNVPAPPLQSEGNTIIDIPRFRTRPEGGPDGWMKRPPPPPDGRPFHKEHEDGEGPRMLSFRPAEQNWLAVEVDRDFVSKVILPEMLTRYLGADYAKTYNVQLAFADNPSDIVYKSDANQTEFASDDAQAEVGLFATRDIGRFFGEERGGKKNGPGRPPDGDRIQRFGGRSRWTLMVRHRDGSLEAIVSKARMRNLGVSGFILLLLIATSAALVRFSRHAQRLAALEMEFIAGVSHELRTPLTVINTAAFNLRGKIAANPAHVERYGKLIQEESQKLTAIVEQVLFFASTKAGPVIRDRAPVSVESVIADCLKSTKSFLEKSWCQVELHVDPDLPVVLGDAVALRQAIQNLITNAAKYGGEGGGWIGVTAKSTSEADAHSVEIRVSDRGPGIPVEEQKHIFDAFYRGQQAIRDQIHGTGLGLSLVKKIVEAHQGTVGVESQPGAGATFVIRIPAGATESDDEFANTSC